MIEQERKLEEELTPLFMIDDEREISFEPIVVDSDLVPLESGI